MRGLIFINREENEKAINEHESIKEEESEELKVTVNLKEIVERESSERIIIEQVQVRLNIIGRGNFSYEIEQLALNGRS